MKGMAIPGAGLVLLLLGATGVSAQSLGDVAKQEEERRKAVRTSGKVYTNDNLRSEPPPSTPAPAAQDRAAQPAAPVSPPSAGGQTPPPSSPTPATPQTEAEWRKRIATVREALSRAQIFVEALQSRINALSTDFVNRDDPAQRDLIAAERQKALSELDRVKQEIQNYQKEITAIQEEARRAGVPAGWVR